jgi:catechol 2,3-dioxygenase-like lactoylglutathione lyase family enzyme
VGPFAIHYGKGCHDLDKIHFRGTISYVHRITARLRQDTLGLRLISEDHFALAFDAHGIMLRVTNVGKAVVAPYTVLGWEIKDIAATVKALQEAGVKFEHYEGLGQDELGVWHAPGGAKVAWFKDPDGNTLSVTQL